MFAPRLLGGFHFPTFEAAKLKIDSAELEPHQIARIVLSTRKDSNPYDSPDVKLFNERACLLRI
jgi:hypothetical protein